MRSMRLWQRHYRDVFTVDWIRRPAGATVCCLSTDRKKIYLVNNGDEDTERLLANSHVDMAVRTFGHVRRKIRHRWVYRIRIVSCNARIGMHGYLNWRHSHSKCSRRMIVCSSVRFNRHENEEDNVNDIGEHHRCRTSQLSFDASRFDSISRIRGRRAQRTAASLRSGEVTGSWIVHEESIEVDNHCGSANRQNILHERMNGTRHRVGITTD